MLFRSLYADNVVLLLSSAASLQRHLDALEVFYDTHDLKVNLGKTKVMIFNTSQPAMHREQFLFADDLVEIVGSYIYLVVLFSGPIFTMHPAMQAQISRGYAALARLERQCYRSHF